MRLRNMPMPLFSEYIKNKEVICFGAGKLLRKACKFSQLEPYVKVVIDNDINKHIKPLVYEGQIFKVYPWNKLKEFSFSREKTVFLIAAGMTGAGRELYEELIRYDIPDGIECFFLSYIFAEPESIKKIGHLLDFKLTKEPIIPKYIHYCWFGGGMLPKEQQKYIEGWHEKCPDFEIIRWDESNYDVKKNNYMKKAYEEKKWGFVPDYARADIIYKYGGIYLDTDVEVIRNLDDHLYQKGFAGIQWDNRINFGLGFGGIPGLDIMAELCEMYDRIAFNFSDGIEMKVGPDYETEILRAHGYNEQKELQVVAELTIYPWEVMSGTMPYSRKSFVTENTASLHHYAGSWTMGKRKMNNQEAMRFYQEIMKSEMIIRQVDFE